MIVSDVLTRVKGQFGDEANVQIKDADIIRWINDAQIELALNNNLLEARGVASIVANQADYTLPADLLTLRSVRFNGQKIAGISAQEAETRFDNFTTTGTPAYFSVWAKSITLFPVPDKILVDGLRFFYSKVPVAVVNVGDALELPIQYHNRIVEYCLQKAYETDENWQAADVKGQQFTKGVDELKGNADWTERDFYPMITSTDGDWD